MPTILGELKRYFRDLGWAVHVPHDAQELSQMQISRILRRAIAQLGELTDD